MYQIKTTEDINTYITGVIRKSRCHAPRVKEIVHGLIGNILNYAAPNAYQ